MSLPFLSRWMRLLVAALGMRMRADSAPTAVGRGVASTLIAIHPVTWVLLVGVPWGVYRLIVRTPSQEWVLFYCAIPLGLALSLVPVYMATRGAFRKARTKGQANESKNVA